MYELQPKCSSAFFWMRQIFIFCTGLHRLLDRDQAEEEECLEEDDDDDFMKGFKVLSYFIHDNSNDEELCHFNFLTIFLIFSVATIARAFSCPFGIFLCRS
jgi:hypothetical protein